MKRFLKLCYHGHLWSSEIKHHKSKLRTKVQAIIVNYLDFGSRCGSVESHNVERENETEKTTKKTDTNSDSRGSREGEKQKQGWFRHWRRQQASLYICERRYRSALIQTPSSTAPFKKPIIMWTHSPASLHTQLFTCTGSTHLAPLRSPVWITAIFHVRFYLQYKIEAGREDERKRGQGVQKKVKRHSKTHSVPSELLPCVLTWEHIHTLNVIHFFDMRMKAAAVKHKCLY